MDRIFNLCRDVAITSLSSTLTAFTAQPAEQPEPETNLKDNMDNEKPKSSDAIFVSYEKYLIVLQSLLLWDKPKDSVAALIIFTISYWYGLIVSWPVNLLLLLLLLLPSITNYIHFSCRCLVWMSSSILSLIFTTCFLLVFLDLWREKLWPEIRGNC